MRELVGHKGYFATEEGEILDSNHNPLPKTLTDKEYEAVIINGELNVSII